jgi:hypothetical protein
MLRSGSDQLSYLAGKYLCLTHRQNALNNEEYKRIFGCILHSKNKNRINRAKCSSNVP